MLFIDDDAEAEFIGFQNYPPEMSADSMINSYLNHDEDEVTSVNTADIRCINWKDNLMEKTIRWVLEDDE